MIVNCVSNASLLPLDDNKQERPGAKYRWVLSIILLWIFDRRTCDKYVIMIRCKMRGHWVVPMPSSGEHQEVLSHCVIFWSVIKSDSIQNHNKGFKLSTLIFKVLNKQAFNRAKRIAKCLETEENYLKKWDSLKRLPNNTGCDCWLRPHPWPLITTALIGRDKSRD